MTLEAALAGFGGRQFEEANDFCLVATAFNVRRSRAMAVFASMFPFLQQREMWCPFKVLGIDFVMAGLAGIGAYVGCARNCTRQMGGFPGRLLATILLVSGVLAGCIR